MNLSMSNAYRTDPELRPVTLFLVVADAWVTSGELTTPASAARPLPESKATILAPDALDSPLPARVPARRNHRPSVA